MSPIGKVFKVTMVFWRDGHGRGQATVLPLGDCAEGASGTVTLKFKADDYIRVVKGL